MNFVFQARTIEYEDNQEINSQSISRQAESLLVEFKTLCLKLSMILD